ncbi:ATP-binding protein [Vibrio genomosp. F6]|uniref:AAA family ATPase n=1 Tax=Vibrio genomosp. F6 str. FF-238 TaxID=1191298 RepID=A0A1E5D6I3_9VIBR|nr:ATP-binding protein [Vibrio genomosp. F6]OEE79210.1 hypothetical protein A130_11805 [Vibrio genomosp. F6 str. FF-238]
MKKIYFVSGIHGVGKGTLCRQLNSELGFSIYSCSDLIKENSEYIEDSKIVTSAERNQRALIRGLQNISENEILLDGHFCLMGKEESIITLDDSVFDIISPTAVICLRCDPIVVYERLSKRDGTAIPVGLLEKLQLAETNRAFDYCNSRSLDLYIYESPASVEPLLKELKSCSMQ